jgi:hypothetical protein
MKELLPKLKKIYEEEQKLTNEDVIKILEASYEFSDYAEDFKDLLSTNDAEIRDYQLDTKQVVTDIRGLGLKICTGEQWEQIIDDCAMEYKIKFIDDWLDPFFDEREYYRTCHEDKAYTKLVLEYDDIDKWDDVIYDEENYVIFR